ncbi:MAG TPA: hypothetical protein VMN81_11030 [Vicinamibacterales bacterium]|nr:hypothetical protein [Vicinamibacterales bacterium]
MSSSITRLAAGMIGVLALVATSACGVAYAQGGRGFPRASTSQAQFDQGFRLGVRAGETDARRGERFNYRDERDWQRAGNRAFRDGFERGYTEAYRRNDRGGYGGGVYADPATAAGFEDGYRQGLEDGRDGDRFDPVRAKRYREGDRGYDRRYGTREQWKTAYRQAFREGYERGYRGIR